MTKKVKDKRIEPSDITKLRNKYGVSIKQLADELDTYARWVQLVEEGIIEVSRWDLIDLATATLAVVIDRVAQERKRREKAEKVAHSSNLEAVGRRATK